MYQTILSHTSLAFAIFFLLIAHISKITASKLKTQNSNWHILMSVSISCYCLLLGINTHIENSHYSNSILLGHWVFSYLSLFCYVNAIEFYLGKKIEVLKFSKTVFLMISSIYALSQIEFQLTGSSIFLAPITDGVITSYSKNSYISTMGSKLGVWIGYFGIVTIVFTNAIIWRNLSNLPGKEVLLRLGIILCLITGAWDTAIGLGHLKNGLPLFYLGFALESLRFMFHPWTEKKS